MPTPSVTLNLATPAVPFSNLFRACIGSCHAYLTLREDYRRQVRQVQRDIGFASIRFHNIFSDLVGICRRESDGTLTFNFRNVDKIYAFLLENGAKPFVELGFMPTTLASGTQTIFDYRANVTPPKDYAEWNRLVRAFVEHLVARFGLNEVLSWRFEVWNEPDLHPWFWTGDQAEYFKLYEHTARTIKAVHPGLKVGGPSSSRNLWIREMLDFCAERAVPIDFISSHHYCADAALAEGKDVSPGITYRGQKAMRADVARTVAAVRTSRFPNLEVHYSEWNVSPCHEDKFGKDSEFNASFILQTLKDMDGLLDSYSYWCISDIFEESGPGLDPFSGKYGLLNVDGIKKPSYHAYKFLAEMLPFRLPSTEESLLATHDGAGNLRLLTWNHCEPESWDFGGADWKLKETDRTETLRVEGVHGRYRVRGFRIDRTAGNAYRAWQALGSPRELTPAQIVQLRQAAEPAPCLDACFDCAGTLELTHTLSPCAVIFYQAEKV